MYPDEWMWDHHAMLQALIADRLAILIWQKTEDGKKGKRGPDPIVRPGYKSGKRKVKGEAVPLDQLQAKMAALQARILAKGAAREKAQHFKRKVEPSGD